MNTIHTGKKVATFKDRFAELCDNNVKSLTSLAQNLHVSKQTISAWRNGTRSPKRPTIVAISNYFKVTIEWLMGFDVEKDIPDEEPLIVPDSELFTKIIIGMSKLFPTDYEMVMKAFEKTETEMRKRGEL